ncbi:MAG: TIGR04150 pseudo-rSAM protein [Bacteroides sp.]|nr:TIGR04150 pseudo-rSAM protein [Bacteroides sp.]
MKEFWLSINSQIYAEFKGDNVLLYNTSNGRYIENTIHEITTLVRELYRPENLGAIIIKEDRLKEQEVREFIQEFSKSKMGKMVDKDEYPYKPVSLIPILNLQKDIDKLNKSNDTLFPVNDNYLNYLREINIYLNTECDNQCTLCQNYYRQIPCCTKEATFKELSLQNIETLFNQIQYSQLARVNFLGGNIYRYTHLNILDEKSKKLRDILHFYVFYTNYQSNNFINSIFLEIIVNFPLKKEILKNILSTIENMDRVTFHFIVEDNEQYDQAIICSQEFDINHYIIHPFYNQKNIAFFEKYVFLQKEDILEADITLREIFRNQKLNVNFWGKLYLYPSGSIRASIHSKIIGNIEINTLADIIQKEMAENTAWRMIRNNKPCSECIYQYFCPAPSNYELTFNRSNLCQINPKTTYNEYESIS